nr:immunoglobulin heavy chain junction region [Mus musculus]NSM05499.1 immunoglobulin heavy chain junction region [Mus musculus]NSM06808.1 immunoglobulin heavy chain junction region [Mus musculus]
CARVYYEGFMDYW